MRFRLPLTKRTQQNLLRIGRMNFSRKNVTEFPTLRHFPFERDILMTVAPNLARSKPMETRHPALSKDIKFKEIGARKGL